MPSSAESRRVSAVLPAGGSGTRMELPVPKQFVEIEGRPLFSYALETFVKHPGIDRVALVIPPSFHDYVTEFLDSLKSHFDISKVILVDGAETRHRSIWNGIKAVERSIKIADDLSRTNDGSNDVRGSRRNGDSHETPDDSSLTPVGRYDDLVVIHDAARPFLDAPTLDGVIDAAWNHGAAGVVRPLVSTVVRPDKDGFLRETLVRAEYRASEMPQAFSLPLISAAYWRCTDDDLDFGTECLEVARKYADARPKLVPGGENLWKVTYAKDLDAVRTQLKAQGSGGGQ